MSKKSKKKKWIVPVMYVCGGNVTVEADTMEEALEVAKNRDGEIPLPTEYEYVVDTWRLALEDPELVRRQFNHNQPDTLTKREICYDIMKMRFRVAEAAGKHLIGHIIFTEDSFDKPYSEEERTYVVSSNNKAFQPHMGGYSIFGTSLDGSDKHVRLDAYMADENGGKDGWKVEKCYILKDEQEEKQ